MYQLLVVLFVQRSGTSDKEAQCRKKTKNELQSLPSRQYLERTVVPVVMDGMSVLAKERSVTNAVILLVFSRVYSLREFAFSAFDC